MSADEAGALSRASEEVGDLAGAHAEECNKTWAQVHTPFMPATRVLLGGTDLECHLRCEGTTAFVVVTLIHDDDR